MDDFVTPEMIGNARVLAFILAASAAALIVAAASMAIAAKLFLLIMAI